MYNRSYRYITCLFYPSCISYKHNAMKMKWKTFWVSVFLIQALTFHQVKSEEYLSNFMLAIQSKIDHQYSEAKTYIEKLPEESFEQLIVNQTAMEIYLRTGDFDNALKFVDLILEENPFDSTANLILNTQLFIEEDFDAALGQNQSYDWFDYRQRLFLAWAYYGLGATQSARLIWDSEDMSAFPAMGYLSTSLILASNKQYEEALEALGSVEDYHDMIYEEVVFHYLKLLLKLEKNEEINELIASWERNSSDSRSVKINNLISFYQNETVPYLDFELSAKEGLYYSLLVFSRLLLPNYPEDALETRRVAAALAPNEILVQLETATLLSQLESHDQAIATLDEIPPNQNYTLYEAFLRSDILAMQDKIGDSIETLNVVSKNFSENVELWFKLGEFQFYDGKYADSVVSITKGLDLIDEESPNYSWYPFYIRGGSYDLLEQYDKMEVDFTLALELAPSNDRVLNHFGYSLAVRNIELERAEEMILSALEVRPKSAAYLDSLGWVYFQMGRYEEAERYLIEADLITPDQFEIIDHIGDLLWVTDRKEDAREKWRRALELNPTEKIEKMIELKLEFGLEEAKEKQSSSE